ncbi:MAG: permease-like cell division protein FtsX [Candidatus Woesebacteria bacterium]|jgi:cell division transport system permease protein
MNIHFKTAWDSIRRAPFQALAAVVVLSITFFVATILSFLVYSSNNLIRYFETRPQVIAFIKDDADTEEVQVLQNRLILDERVEDVNFVSKEMALEIYKKATSDDPLLTELVSPDIFPASLEFSLVNLSFAEEVIDDVRQEEIVDEVGFTASLGGESTLTDVVTKLRNITWYTKVGGGVFVSLLLGTSFLVLMIIIGMRMTTRRGEIEILDLVGATPAFIRSPIVIEAIIYSFSGVFIGWIVNLLLILYATPALISYFGDIPIVPEDTLKLLSVFGTILGIELIIGLFIAVFGSMLAVSRAKKRK